MDSVRLQELVDSLPQGKWAVEENLVRGKNVFHTIVDDDWNILASTWGGPNLSLANLIIIAPALAREVLCLREHVAKISIEKKDNLND